MSRAPQLVRARPKAVEYLPEWAKCCAEAISACQSWGVITIDLSTVERFKAGDYRCSFCGTPYPAIVGVADVADGLMAEMDLLDLDEGPVTQ